MCLIASQTQHAAQRGAAGLRTNANSSSKVLLTMMKTTRRRAHTLRNVTVSVHGAQGQPAPLSNAEKARRELHQLLKTIPTRQHVLIPRNQTEAHRRQDSLCVLLGLSFKVLGPLLFAAAILVTHKRGGLAFSPEGFQLLFTSYTWQDHHRVVLEEKKPSEKALAADARAATDQPIARIKYYYVYRGHIAPKFQYRPLVANNLVVERMVNRPALRAKHLSELITRELDPVVAALFVEPIASSQARSIAVDTSHQNEDGTIALITPTEQQLDKPQQPRALALDRPHYFQSPRVQRMLRSPPARTPGASPPLRRMRLGQDVGETIEEEKKDEMLEDNPPVTPARPSLEDEVKAYLSLNFDLRNYEGLRPARNPASRPIEVADRRQATPIMRTQIVWLAEKLGYQTTRLKKDKLVIAEAASRAVFYDCGVPQPPKGRMVADWFDELDQARQNLNNFDFGSALTNEKLGTKKGTYCDRIETAYPNYLRELYRKAGRNPKVTFRATFAELATEMNRLSALEAPARPQLFLTRETLKRWFRNRGGKVRKGWERPILTPDRMKGRVEWCKARKAEMAEAEAAGKKCYYCFLDEKWFYIRSRRKKLKVLPRGPLEETGAEDIPIERESSRRHATKVMVLGVIADPDEENNFDGKIYFTRVARNQKFGRATYTDKILDELAPNAALHRQWPEFVSGTDAETMKTSVTVLFDLDLEIRQRLVFRYIDHNANGDRVWKTFDRFNNKTICPEPGAARRALTVRDLVLQVKYSKDDERPIDVSCDSEFMKEHMDAIGKAIRDKHHWVPAEDEIFLVMDNAGGHGTRDTIDKYVADLLEDHKVRVIWQEPRGPELNLLDLGAWMSLQSAVEKHFRGNRNDVEVLWRKIVEVWSIYDASVFRKIWNRWVLALDLVIADGGNNRLVNEHRGALFTAAAPLPAEEAPPPPAEDYDIDANLDDGDDGDDDDDI